MTAEYQNLEKADITQNALFEKYLKEFIIPTQRDDLSVKELVYQHFTLNE